MTRDTLCQAPNPGLQRTKPAALNSELGMRRGAPSFLVY
jgi:hypothetical protein